MDNLPDPWFDAVSDTRFAPELKLVVEGIAAAPGEPGLQQASASIQSLARSMVGHVHAQVLTRVISALNDGLARRVIDLCSATLAPAVVPWCWIALGSEGRQEQTFASDQDNGIVFADAGQADEQRRMLLPLALRINHTLAACGFPLCPGQVMASNPQWCLSVHEWRGRFHNWLTESDPRALLNATIFFDLRPLHGECTLAHTLLDWLAVNASDNPRFLFQMAENALHRQPPLGLLRDFVVEREGGTIDLKLQAATLFVDAARVFGLASGSRSSSNSADRLLWAAAAHYLDMGEVEEWTQALYVIQGLRLKHQQAGAAMPNRVDPYRLSQADRRALLHALHQARALQRRLEHVFLDSAQGI